MPHDKLSARPTGRPGPAGRSGPSFGLLVLALFFCSTMAAVPARGQDDCPITPVPSDRWGALEPRAIMGDGSCWDFSSVPNADDPYWHDVDVENGWVFGAAGKGITIHDARTNPGNPSPFGYEYAPPIAPKWFQSDQKMYLFDIDAPPGVDTVVATATSGNGLLVWNTQDKAAATIHYQDAPAGEATQVWTTTIGGRHYAFLAISDGFRVYDLTKATEYSGCRDSSQNNQISCPGVYLGKFGSGLVSKLDGFGTYLAVSLGTSGVGVWDVSTPSSPVEVMAGGDPASGVAIWLQDGTYWLGAGGTSLRIYDVTDITSPACHSTPCSLPGPSKTISLGANPSTVVDTESDGVPFLFVSASGNIGDQLEWVFDVTTPTSPRDVTPQVHPDGYWGWYYAKNPTGFRWVSSGKGKFSGEYLYHTSFGGYDVHEFVGEAPPSIGSVSVSPAEPVQCQTVSFTANDVAGNPPPTLSWEVLDDLGTPAASGGDVNPFSWTTDDTTAVGDYTAEATADNALGSDTVSSPVFTLGSLPTLGVQTPTNDPFGVNVVQFHVASTGASEWSWDFGDGLGYQCPSEAGEWCTDPVDGPNPVYEYDELGTFQVRVRVQNCVEGPITSDPLEIEIDTLDPLVASFQASGIPCFGGFCDASTGEEITFSDGSTGDPDTWRYDWDGNGSFEEDSPGVPASSHTYFEPGSYVPVLKVERGVEDDVDSGHPTIIVEGPSLPFFEDGFESGDTSIWSETVPSGEPSP